MSKEIPIAAVRRKSSRAAFISAAGFLIVVAAIGVSMWQLGEQRDQLRLGRDAIARQVDALQHVQRALSFLSAQSPQYDAAVVELSAADEILSFDGEGADTVERRAELRGPVLRVLAETHYLSGHHDLAVGALETAAALPAVDSALLTADTIFLAKYHCANGDVASARALITPDFARDHAPELSGETGFQTECAALVAELTASAGPTTTTTTAPDPEYQITMVYLQMRHESDRAIAAAVGAQMCAGGYSAPGVELVAEGRPYPAAGGVRYYYPEQQGQAQSIAETVGALIGVRLEARPVVGLQGLPRDRVEIWLPEAVRLTDSREGGEFPCFVARDTQTLVSQLNSSSRGVRLLAGQVVGDRIRNPADTEIVDALLAQLAYPRLEALSTSGRLNVLFMLNLRPAWSDSRATTLSQQLDVIERGGSQHQAVAVGRQTGDCISSLREKIAGRAGNDRCGV